MVWVLLPWPQSTVNMTHFSLSLSLSLLLVRQRNEFSKAYEVFIVKALHFSLVGLTSTDHNFVLIYRLLWIRC
jgi:hypothetical protein